MDNFLIFLQFGFYHILGGYDHLLFLFGLIIVSPNLKSLLAIASAFTVTHSATLILCALGILSFNSSLTEILIAASIVYVGIENLISKEIKYRWMIAAVFGLIHGAGFSGHLTELLRSMFEMGEIWGPIIGFNIGIELGQILVALIYPFYSAVKDYSIRKIMIKTSSILIAVSGLILIVLRIWQFNI